MRKGILGLFDYLHATWLDFKYRNREYNDGLYEALEEAENERKLGYPNMKSYNNFQEIIDEIHAEQESEIFSKENKAI
ncbi:MAG: hypothetical protein ACK5LZ_06175 [Anaerorhabdus sp.]